jgi:hypothetical protein
LNNLLRCITKEYSGDVRGKVHKVHKVHSGLSGSLPKTGGPLKSNDREYNVISIKCLAI